MFRVIVVIVALLLLQVSVCVCLIRLGGLSWLSYLLFITDLHWFSPVKATLPGAQTFSIDSHYSSLYNRIISLQNTPNTKKKQTGPFRCVYLPLLAATQRQTVESKMF